MDAIPLHSRLISGSILQFYAKIDSVEFIISEVVAHTKLASHHHPEAQIGLGLSGNLSFRINSAETILRKNAAYYIAPNVPHNGFNNTDVNFVGLDIKYVEKNQIHSNLSLGASQFSNSVKTVTSYFIDGMSISVNHVVSLAPHYSSLGGVYIFLNGARAVMDTKKIFQSPVRELICPDNPTLEYIIVDLQPSLSILNDYWRGLRNIDDT